MNCLAFLNEFVSFPGIIVLALFLVTLAIHFTLAMAVWADALKFALDEKRRLTYLPSWGWGAATLITGLLGATSYWLIHRSTLRRDA